MKKNKMKKFLAFASSVIMTYTFAACGNGGSSESSSKNDGNLVGYDGNYSPDDMPDNASTILMTKEESGTPIQLEYISGQLNSDQGKLLCRYFNAVGNKDAATLETCVYGGYFDLLLGKETITDIDDYAAKLYNSYVQFTGGNFVFNYLIQDSTAEADFDMYDEIVAAFAPESQIEERTAVNIDAYISSEELNLSSVPLKNRMDGEMLSIVIYKIDGQYYIMG